MPQQCVKLTDQGLPGACTDKKDKHWEEHLFNWAATPFMELCLPNWIKLDRDWWLHCKQKLAQRLIMQTGQTRTKNYSHSEN